MTNYLTPLKQQSGAVLAISLVLLLLLTLIGVTSSQVTGLEEKMAGNMRDRNLAFQAAESALRAGEVAAAAAGILSCPGANPPGFFRPADINCNGDNDIVDNPLMDPKKIDIWHRINWSTQSVLYVGNSIAEVSADPRFIVEYMGTVCISATSPCPAADLRRNYRITARATGGTTDAVVILQSTIQVL